MAFESGIRDLFGNRTPSRQGYFDINILPMNLYDGRNIGDLSCLFVFTAPQKSGKNRQNEVLFILFHVTNMTIPQPRLKEWAFIISNTYFASRGSFTMGMSSAVKKLSAFIEKEMNDQIMPTIFMNTAVLKDRTLMIAHAGPVHSTIISSDKVQNFNNESCLPVQLKNNELSFFTADVHSEDIILLCPNVPNDWTNSSILEVTGDSPLNAIRFLLDRSGGNLQAAVIQLKTGKGQISIRSKTVITANVKQEKVIPDDMPKAENNFIFNNEHSGTKPLFRQRKIAEPFEEMESDPDVSEKNKDNDPENNLGVNDQTESPAQADTKEFPGAENLPYDFSEINQKDKVKETEKETIKNKVVRKPQKKIKNPPSKGRRKFNFKRFLLILFCGLLIPVIVVAVLFFIYSGRSKDQLHREYLSYAVAAAQKAIQSPDLKSKEALWLETIDYTDQALSYGESQAARDLRKEAIERLDDLNGGISTIYNYANQNKLPQGLNITEIQSSGQFTYALDATSGSVIRFVASGNGLALDNSFKCDPGTYPEYDTENSTIQVSALRDFTILPSGNPHSFVLAGIDKDGNVLYCSSMKNSQAAKLRKPESGKFQIDAISFSNNAMYVLDKQSSAVWEFLFSNSDGFIYEPSNYYGSYSPFLSDIIDFTMFKEYSYFLRENGTLLVCDYTGYRPACSNLNEVHSADGSAYLNFANHKFKKILVNSSPDNSIYIMDAKLQTILNLSTKLNFIRYIVPNRAGEEISQFSEATAFGITGQNRLLWGYKNDLYIGNMP